MRAAFVGGAQISTDGLSVRRTVVLFAIKITVRDTISGNFQFKSQPTKLRVI